MITCSSRDKRHAKANLNHEGPKPIKMLSSPLILIARRKESNWSSCILGFPAAKTWWASAVVERCMEHLRFGDDIYKSRRFRRPP